jgi:hypothetical protein
MISILAAGGIFAATLPIGSLGGALLAAVVKALILKVVM